MWPARTKLMRIKFSKRFVTSGFSLTEARQLSWPRGLWSAGYEYCSLLAQTIKSSNLRRTRAEWVREIFFAGVGSGADTEGSLQRGCPLYRSNTPGYFLASAGVCGDAAPLSAAGSVPFSMVNMKGLGV